MSRLFVGSCMKDFDLEKTVLKPSGRFGMDSRKSSRDEKKLESIDEFERRMHKEYEEFLRDAEEVRKIIDPYRHGAVYRLGDIGRFYRLSDIGKYYRMEPLPEGDWMQDGIAKYYRLDPLPIGRGWDNDDIARFNDWTREYTDEEFDALRERFDDSEDFVRRLLKSK